MDKAILQDVKTSIGINPDMEDETFDSSLIMCINADIAELAELGIKEVGDFSIESKNETWADYLGEEYAYLLSLVKAHVNTATKLMFDAPQSGSLANALEEQKNRLDFRIIAAIETHLKEE